MRRKEAGEAPLGRRVGRLKRRFAALPAKKRCELSLP